MTAGDWVGWLAAALTLLTFSMRSMVALRLLAIAANMSFIAYGAAAGLTPVLVLHLLLVPCNLLRLWQSFARSRAGDTTDTGLPEPRTFRRLGSPSASAGPAGRDWLIVGRPKRVRSVPAKRATPRRQVRPLPGKTRGTYRAVALGCLL